MIVTDKKYSMDEMYLSKLDLMIKRMKGTDDAILLLDGDEGQGKTEFAVGTCYYVSQQMNRKYDVDNVFFDLDEGMMFASQTHDQIIHFDEGALGLLSTQWWNKNQQKFLQLVMTARKKRHFMIICIPKFYKMNQYIVEERSIGLIHVYSRKNLHKGRFCYFTKAKKERLFQDWRRKKIKNYRKYYSFHGSFVQTMKKVFTPEQLVEYERKKDKAIESICAVDKKPEVSERAITLKIYSDWDGRNSEKTLEDAAEVFGVSSRTICRWKKALNKDDTTDYEGISKELTVTPTL